MHLNCFSGNVICFVKAYMARDNKLINEVQSTGTYIGKES